jgi:hypothetical protein
VLTITHADSARVRVEALDIINANNPFVKKELPIKTKIEKPKPTFELSGVFESSALINDEWVDVGKSLDGYILKELTSDKAVLQSSDDLVVIKLYDDWGLK